MSVCLNEINATRLKERTMAMSAGGDTSTLQVRQGGHGCLVTLLWFVFVGWWLSAIWIAVAWFLIALIITMPIGLMMINVLPKIASLREPSQEFRTTIEGTITRVEQTNLRQYPFVLRAIYFLLIGWWLSGIWMSVGWVASVTIVGLPVAIWMFNRVPLVTTLRRY
jgi:uncharacterized membrane protein YccF (DUF307 family)